MTSDSPPSKPASAHDDELILVYNADSGFFNAVFSSVHKFVSPETYACELCRISHGLTGMLGAWRTYLDQLPLPVRSYHRDQFHAEFPDAGGYRLPAILLRVEGSDFRELVGGEQIARADNLVTLINLVNHALEENGYRKRD